MTMCPCPDCKSACELAVVIVAVVFVGRRGENVVPLANWIVLGRTLVAVIEEAVGPVPETTLITSTALAFENGIVIILGDFLITIVGVLVSETNFFCADWLESPVMVCCICGEDGCSDTTCTRDKPIGTAIVCKI